MRRIRVTTTVGGEHLRRAARILQSVAPGGPPDVLDVRLDSLADAFDRDEIVHVPARVPKPADYVPPFTWTPGEDHAEVALLDALREARSRHGRMIIEIAFNREHGLAPGPGAVDLPEWARRHRSEVHDIVRAIRLVRADRPS